jgi:hypothetical protein
MRYEGYTSNERTDDILDKISKYGIKSLTSLEKEFLDAHKSGQEEEYHDKLAKSENLKMIMYFLNFSLTHVKIMEMKLTI